MPGLLRGVARTAVVAGTATAVSNRVSRRQAGRWAAQDQQQYAQRGVDPVDPDDPPVRYEGQTPDPMGDKISQLRELGELKAQGVLTEAEFERQKQRILA